MIFFPLHTSINPFQCWGSLSKLGFNGTFHGKKKNKQNLRGPELSRQHVSVCRWEWSSCSTTLQHCPAAQPCRCAGARIRPLMFILSLSGHTLYDLMPLCLILAIFSKHCTFGLMKGSAFLSDKAHSLWPLWNIPFRHIMEMEPPESVHDFVRACSCH